MRRFDDNGGADNNRDDNDDDVVDVDGGCRHGDGGAFAATIDCGGDDAW